MSDNAIKLSFVIPAYNEQAYLGDCLASVVEQIRGRQDVEVIVVNNASTDKTKPVALGFPGVKVVDEPNKGIVFARRAGFLAARGELIANIDADVRLTPGWVDKVLERFARDPKLVAYSGPFDYFDASRIAKGCAWAFYCLAYVLYLINRLIFGVGMLQGGNFVFKKSAWERVGGYNTRDFTFYGEDTDVARRISSVGKVVFSFDLPIYSSARRLKKEGMFMVGARYVINYFWTVFFKRPYHQEYEDSPKN